MCPSVVSFETTNALIPANDIWASEISSDVARRAPTIESGR